MIVGAGGHGRCCLDIARGLNQYDEICFLDDQYVNQKINGSNVIGLVEDMVSYYIEFEDIFIAIGNSKKRKQLMEKAKVIGYTLATLISKDAYVSEYATVEEGSVVFPFAVLEANSKVGKGCIVTANVTINHDAILEDFVLVYSNSVIRPEAKVEEFSLIESNCVVAFGSNVKANSYIKTNRVAKEGL